MPSEAHDDTSYREQRRRLVARLRADGHIHDPRVAQAMQDVPREEFVPIEARPQAYLDQPLEIGHGQTISAPHMVAIMSDALLVHEGQKVLEVGTGSGYQAAVLGRLVGPTGRVVTMERHADLLAQARDSLARTGAKNVTALRGDGSLGHADRAPYDRIVVTAAAPRLPPPLVEQLAAHGILLVPVGERVCELIRARKTDGRLEEESLGPCAFVPLKGAHGHRLRFFGI